MMRCDKRRRDEKRREEHYALLTIQVAISDGSRDTTGLLQYSTQVEFEYNPRSSERCERLHLTTSSYAFFYREEHRR